MSRRKNKKQVVVYNKYLTRANAWTISGIIAILFYAFQFTTGFIVFLAPLVFFYGAVVSDLLDGASARRHNNHTRIGKIIDPIRDRLAGLVVVANMLFLKGVSVIAIEYFVVLILVETCIIMRCFLGFSTSHLFSKLRHVVHIVCGMIFICQTYWDFWIFPIVSVNILIFTMATSSSIVFFVSTEQDNVVTKK